MYFFIPLFAAESRQRGHRRWSLRPS